MTFMTTQLNNPVSGHLFASGMAAISAAILSLVPIPVIPSLLKKMFMVPQPVS